MWGKFGLRLGLIIDVLGKECTKLACFLRKKGPN